MGRQVTTGADCPAQLALLANPQVPGTLRAAVTPPGAHAFLLGKKATGACVIEVKGSKHNAPDKSVNIQMLIIEQGNRRRVYNPGNFSAPWAGELRKPALNHAWQRAILVPMPVDKLPRHELLTSAEIMSEIVNKLLPLHT